MAIAHKSVVLDVPPDPALIQMRQQAAVADLTQRALFGQSPVSLFHEAAEVVAAVLNVPRSAIFEDGDACSVLRAGIGWHVDLVGLATIQRGAGSLSDAVSTSVEPLRSPDSRADRRFDPVPLLTEHGIVSMLLTSIRIEDKPFGMLGAFAADSREFTDDETRFVQTVAGTLSAAIARYRAEEALREGDERRRFADKVTNILASSLDYEATLAAVARLTVPILADWCAIFLVDDNRQIRRVELAASDPERELLLRQILDRFPPVWDAPVVVARAIRSGQPLLAPVTSSAWFLTHTYEGEHRQLLDTFGLRSAMAVPLISRGHAIGAINFGSTTPGHFGQSQLAVAVDLAGRAAVAIDNARLYHEAQEAAEANRRQAARLRVLAEASQTFGAASLDLQATLEGVARRTAELAGDACIIRLLSDDGEWFVPVAVHHPDPTFKTIPLDRRANVHRDADDGLYGELARTGRPVVITNAPPDQIRYMIKPEFWPDVVQRQRYSLLIAPLRVHGRIIGTLGTGRSDSDAPYNADDQLFLQDLADRAALAIDNARLFQLTAEATRRQAFLAEAGSLLASSLEYEETLGQVARLAVPSLADWCIVYQAEGDGPVRRVELAAADPATQALLQELQERHPGGVTERTDVAAAIRAGKSTLIAEVDEAQTRLIASDADHFRVLNALNPRSLIIVPLVARERERGALLLARTDPKRPYGAADLALAEDLAHRAALAVDNAALFREAQEAIRARDHFLSIAAHELRTPVAGVKGFAQMLLRSQSRGTLTPERLAQSLTTIDHAAGRLSTLTNDLLDVSRIRLGQLPLRPRALDFVALVRDIARRHHDVLSDGHRLQMDLADLHCPVEVDPERTDQVLSNVLDNAAKYSPDGGDIEITLRPNAEGILLSVRDDGIGLPPGAAERIFQPFGRAANATEHNLPGMGLGLYICRNIVERHGGRIWAESAGEGTGTTIYLWLPCQTTA